MNRRFLLFIIAVALIAFPRHALANAGTPLMWAGMFHLAIGNLFIGALEGWLLVRLFAVPGKRPFATMIGANYFSAWVGGLFLNAAIVRYLPMDLNNGWLWFWLMAGVTYCITLLLELPFVYLLVRSEPGAFKRSLKSSLAVQSISYILLFGWYGVAGETSLFTRANVVAPGTMALPDGVVVYFISAADGSVYRRELNGNRETRVFDLKSSDLNDRLLVRPCQGTSNRWDLVARLETEDHRNPTIIPVLTNKIFEVALEWPVQTHQERPYRSTWSNHGQVPVIGGATNRPLSYWAGFWEASGLRVYDRASKSHERFAFETPFGAWAVRNAVQLTNDHVIFQLGRDQVCAFNPRTRSVALLFHGRGPVPVLEAAGLR